MHRAQCGRREQWALTGGVRASLACRLVRVVTTVGSVDGGRAGWWGNGRG